jgi:spore coat protein H
MTIVTFGCGPSQGETPRPNGAGTGGAGGTVATGGAQSTGATGGATGGSGPGGSGATIGGSGGSVTAGAGGASGGSVAAGASGAGAGAPPTAGSGNAGGSAGMPAGSGGSAGEEPDFTREIYDPTRFPRFDFELPQASVAALEGISGPEDPDQDSYVTGTFTYDKDGANEVVTNIGVRIKGEGSFLPFDQKPALKIKFDAFVDMQRFRGLARLTLNNNYDDPSFVAERLAYDVYREAGVPAPRGNSAQVYVNGEFYGVYTNLESEDKHFLKRWFPTDGGNLFEKDGQGDFRAEDADDFQLETNETANDRTDLNALIASITSATDPNTFLDTIGSNMDTANWLKFTAVEAAVNQWDSYSFTIWWPHNFRIYDDPTASKFYFIPWGHDLSMKPALFTGKQFVEPFTLARTSDDDNGQVSSGILFQRCLASPSCKAAYKATLQQVVTVWEGLDMEARAARYYEQVQAQVYADERKRVPDGLLADGDFDAAYQEVLAIVRGRVAALNSAISAN